MMKRMNQVQERRLVKLANAARGGKTQKGSCMPEACAGSACVWHYDGRPYKVSLYKLWVLTAEEAIKLVTDADKSRDASIPLFVRRVSQPFRDVSELASLRKKGAIIVSIADSNDEEMGATERARFEHAVRKSFEQYMESKQLSSKNGPRLGQFAQKELKDKDRGTFSDAERMAIKNRLLGSAAISEGVR